jgi:hypothetical protein
MEPLQARIVLIDINNGQYIGYFYFREAFEKVKTKYCPEDKSHFIDVGNIIEYEGGNFKVIKINFKMEPELNKAQYSGTGELSVFDTADRNCQIGVFVEKA